MRRLTTATGSRTAAEFRPAAKMTKVLASKAGEKHFQIRHSPRLEKRVMLGQIIGDEKLR
jgi:hypothetical protein